MKTGKTLVEMAVEIERRKNAKVDYLADTRQMNMNATELGLTLGIEGKLSFDVGEIAHDQIGEKLKIPATFYDRCRASHPDLLAHNVNTLFQREPSRHMIRTLDGTMRAFLSDRYKPIDNDEIAEAIFPIIGGWMQEGATVESAEITERRMYIKVVNPRIQTEVVPGDIVQSGIVISNSETGMGSVSVMPMVFRLMCSNGMIRADAGQRRVHVGRVNEVDDNYVLYRNETVLANDKAFIMKLQDVVRSTADAVHFERIVNTMRDARDAKITGDVPAVVQIVAKTHRITEGEGKGVLDHLIRGGDLSLYGVANAITRQAHDIDSYDRSTELEMIGFNVLAMSAGIWKNINTAVPV
jgi:hypothetical protein